MKNFRSYSVIILLLLLTACGDKIGEEVYTIEKLDGFVQKGPFLNGTSITVSELTKDLNSTGKVFSSQILDNLGSFEIRNVGLTSRYVELKADGFYFNEVTDENSSAQLTLYALSDISDKNSLNVNILSHLEKNRVTFLVSSGMKFEKAKKQAQEEILSIFGISDELPESELLDITSAGGENAVLLAISIILQGYQDVSDLSELLANISSDIRQDGILDSEILGSTLVNNATFLDLEDIRQNLEDRYEALGLDIAVPAFENYVTTFLETTDFTFTGNIEYPESGSFGLNILDRDMISYPEGIYSMKAILPEGSGLKVRIQGRNWYFQAFQDNTGWVFSDWNFSDDSRLFTATRTGSVDFKIELAYQNSAVRADTVWVGDSAQITYVSDSTANFTNLYIYENESYEPTWTKTLQITQN